MVVSCCINLAGNSKIKGRMWPEFELVLDFTPVLVICKFDDDLPKNKVVIVSTTFSKAGNSKVNGQMWPHFKLIRDFMTCYLQV